jgi:photosystem II stability/assembly factor-like uncharacterized protein
MTTTMRHIHQAVRLASLAAAASVLLLATGPARANGRFPASTGFSADRTDQQRLILRATFGQLLSKDGGRSFRWLCEGAIGYRPGTFDPPVIAQGDRLLIGSPTGLYRSTNFGCDWTPVPMLLPYQVTDLAADPENGDTVYASTAISGLENGIFLSKDGGQTFTSLISKACDTFFLSVKVAPSNGQRIYSSAYQDFATAGGDAGPGPDIATSDAGGPAQPDGGTGTCPTSPAGGPTFVSNIYRSDDAGKTWTALPFTFNNLKVVHLLAVSPTDPDTLYARVTDYSTTPSTETVIISKDGGATFTMALQLDEVDGFVVEADGKTAWVTSANKGLFRSTDGATFTRVMNAPHAACLGPGLSPGEIYLCGQNFLDHAALFRTTDGGQTFTKVFAFDQMCGTLDCPAGSSVGTQCTPDMYANLAGQLGIPTTMMCQPAPDDGGTLSDAPASMEDSGPGTDTGVPPHSSSCMMPASPAAPSSAAGAGLALLSLVVLGVARAGRRKPRR